jgi:hypothetical protein
MWSYDSSALGTSTSSERLNSVRFLVGDTDTNDQLVQDEEIQFSLTQTGDNVYYAASFIAETLAAKYSRRVDTKLDGALSAEYSQLASQYRLLAVGLKQQGQRYSGTALGVSYGGVRITDINSIRDDTDRVTPSFRRDRFKFPRDSYLNDFEDGD